MKHTRWVLVLIRLLPFRSGLSLRLRRHLEECPECLGMMADVNERGRPRQARASWAKSKLSGRGLLSVWRGQSPKSPSGWGSAGLWGRPG
jgi:hypothetical protein